MEGFGFVSGAFGGHFGRQKPSKTTEHFTAFCCKKGAFDRRVFRISLREGFWLLLDALVVLVASLLGSSWRVVGPPKLCFGSVVCYFLCLVVRWWSLGCVSCFLSSMFRVVEAKQGISDGLRRHLPAISGAKRFPKPLKTKVFVYIWGKKCFSITRVVQTSL